MAIDSELNSNETQADGKKLINLMQEKMRTSLEGPVSMQASQEGKARAQTLEFRGKMIVTIYTYRLLYVGFGYGQSFATNCRCVRAMDLDDQSATGAQRPV
ncbi:hypothetical protein OCU04_008025 [Sclerotinia nivalis]|uniref:Uncharacterized protein n=1 Tax=Sclerotinia nivalis TaxID=352851 RepID=A0A9X0AHC4_9HELO|nr:hypothetical protein OCU04_008025 [Sclerotinia nivalis]